MKANMQYNKQLNSTLNNNISNTTNTSLLSHPDGKKLIENSEKKLGNNKKLYSPSSTQETHRSNNSHLTRTETHLNKIIHSNTTYIQHHKPYQMAIIIFTVQMKIKNVVKY
eukprot:275181_1